MLDRALAGAGVGAGGRDCIKIFDPADDVTNAIWGGAAMLGFGLVFLAFPSVIMYYFLCKPWCKQKCRKRAEPQAIAAAGVAAAALPAEAVEVEVMVRK